MTRSTEEGDRAIGRNQRTREGEMGLSTRKGTTERGASAEDVAEETAAAVTETVREMLKRPANTYETVAVAAGETARRVIRENSP